MTRNVASSLKPYLQSSVWIEINDEIKYLRNINLTRLNIKQVARVAIDTSYFFTITLSDTIA